MNDFRGLRSEEPERSDAEPLGPDTGERVAGKAERGGRDDPELPSSQYGSALRRSMSMTVNRIDDILRSAENAAYEIRREAEREAARYMDECRRRADEEAERRRAATREAYDALRRSLDEIERGYAADHHLPDIAPRPEPAVQPESQEPPPPDAREAALIRAAQLAVTGVPRIEIVRSLRTELGIESPEEIVDEIVGDAG